MAKLRIPEHCTACGAVLMEHDVIIMERQATLRTNIRYRRVRDFSRYGWRNERYEALEPRIAAMSPTNVRHKVCP